MDLNWIENDVSNIHVDNFKPFELNVKVMSSCN